MFLIEGVFTTKRRRYLLVENNAYQMCSTYDGVQIDHGTQRQPVPAATIVKWLDYPHSGIVVGFVVGSSIPVNSGARVVLISVPE